MTELKIKKLQQSILNEITSAVNNSMSIDDKLAVVKATINRYDTQLNILQIDSALRELAEKDKAIVGEAKNG